MITVPFLDHSNLKKNSDVEPVMICCGCSSGSDFLPSSGHELSVCEGPGRGGREDGGGGAGGGVERAGRVLRARLIRLCHGLPLRNRYPTLQCFFFYFLTFIQVNDKHNDLDVASFLNPDQVDSGNFWTVLIRRRIRPFFY